MKVATDVGGTFTDYIMIDHEDVSAFKKLTTLDPSTGISEELDGHYVTDFSHGTTVAVNAVLQRKGADLIFFTTKGFSDLVRIGRQARSNVYSFLCEKPEIPVGDIVEVAERVNSNREVIEKISETELMRPANELAKRSEVAVVGFLNSYANPVNEIQAEQILSKFYPIVIPSYKVRREIREYERFCTAVMEGYCTPVVKNYLDKLKDVGEQFHIMQSNGGKSEVEHLRAVNILMSGPAGGVAATQALCKRLGIKNAIAYDMGGTSVDVSAIVAGEPQFTDTIKITEIPVKSMAIDIESIGAGGGSIAWIDDGGALKVGPQSAGSSPGPACYNLGGSKFTVTDANLVLGILGGSISDVPLVGKNSIDAGKPLCRTLNMDIMELSQGTRRIVNNNMVAALKRVSLNRGYDPRKFSLVAFGGAGPMHACAIARMIGISRIIIPPMAGAFSALGIMSAPLRFDYVRTVLSTIVNTLDILPGILVEFETDLRNKLSNRFNDSIRHLSLDMRYYGQGHEINIPFALGQGTDQAQALTDAFHTKHRALFGFDMPENKIEVLNIKLVAELPGIEIPTGKFTEGKVIVRSTRDVQLDSNVQVYRKDFHGFEVAGPCIIDDDTTTIYVEHDWNAKLDLFNTLTMECD